MRSVSYRDFLAVNRGGGLYSSAVSQRLGALFALLAFRRGLSPAVLSLMNVLFGLSGSLLAPLSGLCGLVGWQLAYAFDCADGQLARATGRASPAGARLDVLCDLVVQISVVTSLAVFCPSAPGWLLALFAGTWLVNLVTSVLQSSYPVSLLPSAALPVRLLKLTRDYGFVVLVAGAVVTIRPQWTLGLVLALTILNGSYLLAALLRPLSPR